jgi:serine/threonine protein kinase
MEGALKSGTLLVSDSGNRYKVIRLLGAGAQGEVYEIERGTARAALKWYFPKRATVAQRRILEKLIAKGAPDESFLWPEDSLTQDTSGSLGYVMRLRPREYKGIVDMMKRRAEPSFAVLCRAAFNLTHGYQKLHSLGYSYRDISFGNVFFNPDDGNVLICDNDNVSASGDDDSPIYGTPRFMAPEIVVGAAKPSRNTDLYSLSVLLFYMLMLHHPLEGKREADIKCMDVFAMTRLFGQSPLFIFDPHDESNRPVRGYQDNAIVYWEVYPRFLKDLFETAFTVGLSQPNRRVTENQWLDALSNLLSQIIPCPKCGAEVFCGVGKCWACGGSSKTPPLLSVEKRRIALTTDAVLYSHHINVDYDLKKTVGRVVQNPNDPGRIGIRNETENAWTYVKNDGTQLAIAPGKSAAVVGGTKLIFGGAANSTMGEILSTTGG